MDVFECIFGRRSVRSFLKEDVKDEHLEKIIEAAIHAPSAGNLQSWEFYVLRSRETKRKIADAALGQRFIEEAPVVIVVCANENVSSLRYGLRGKELYCIQDTAAATQNILLSAYALGYGSCWVGAFMEDEVSRILKTSPGVRPVAIIPIGKPAEIPRKPPRRRPKVVFL
ncbi:MAG: nitroreductase family protein [Candidatus Asgardarchaeia archaeon]